MHGIFFSELREKEMPELWESCNTKSIAILIQLYWAEYGIYPDFYYEKKREPIINAPDFKELESMEVEKEMRQPPKHQERVE